MNFLVIFQKNQMKKKKQWASLQASETLQPLGFAICTFNKTVYVAPNFPSRSDMFDDNHVSLSIKSGIIINHKI